MKILQFHRIISLGRACDIAYQIRRVFNQAEAYPFDWLVTPMSGLIKVIQSDFDGFIDADHLEIRDNRVVNQESNIVFFHDFEEQQIPTFKQALPQVMDKYKRRIERWRTVVNSGNPILFVKGSNDTSLGVITEDQARLIYDTLTQAYPHCDVHLLCQNVPEAGIAPQRIGNIRIDNVRKPASAAWSGDDAAWSEMLTRHAA